MRALLILVVLLQGIALFGQTASEWRMKGDELYYRGKKKEAVQAYTEAIELSPDSAWFYIYRAKAEEKDFASIERDLDKAVELEPENDRLYFERGKFYGSSIYFVEQEIEEYDKALKFVREDSMRVKYYNAKGMAYWSKREFYKAQEEVMKAYDIDSSSILVLNSLALIAGERGDFSRSEVYLKRIIYIEPNDVLGFMNLGFYYQKQEMYDSSIVYLNRAIEIDPNYSGFTWNNRGFSKFKLGDTKGALKDINKSLELAPYNSYAYRNRAMVYLQQKNVKAACEDLKYALKLGYTQQYGRDVQEMNFKNCD